VQLILCTGQIISVLHGNKPVAIEHTKEMNGCTDDR
jgi:hypothetical protein